VTLKWYAGKEESGAYDKIIANCDKASNGKYKIVFAPLPASADDQREQLVRRLASHDSDIDIIGVDIPWIAEFSAAGWMAPWPKAEAAKVTKGAIPSTVKSVTYQGKVMAAPFTSNAQLLWYRKDLVKQPPATWDEMIKAAEQLPAGKNLIEVQGERYEGLTVWFASLEASAGGSITDPAGKHITLPAAPTKAALGVMRDLSRSKVADPSLSTTMEDQARLAFEAGKAAFELNYSFVWPAAQADKPDLAKNMGFARWPSVKAGEPSHVTLGGLHLGIGAFSKHKDLAFQAAECMRSPDNQAIAASVGGLAPSDDAVFDNPKVRKTFPFADVLRDSIRDAVLRPPTPAYNDVTVAIQNTLHPTRSIQPDQTYETLKDRLGHAIKSEGLL
jgi:multiple sugar transport system substrate-binding protein